MLSASSAPIGDATHWEWHEIPASPVSPRNQVTRATLMHITFTTFPAMEDVEDVIVSSGPIYLAETGANFSDPHHPAGRHRVHGFWRRADLETATNPAIYRTYCVGKEPSQEQKDTYATALGWLYDSIGAVKAGTTTPRRSAMKMGRRPWKTWGLRG